MLTSINPQLTGELNHFYCFLQFLELFFLLPIFQHYHHKKKKNQPFQFSSFFFFFPKSSQALFFAPESQIRGIEKRITANISPISSFHQDAPPCIPENTQGTVTREKLVAHEFTIPLEMTVPPLQFQTRSEFCIVIV